jgi:hypothetical protein
MARKTLNSEKNKKAGENQMPTVVFEVKGNGLPKFWSGRNIKAVK